MQKMKRVGEIVFWGVIALATAIVLLVIFYHSTVHAHDHNRPDLNDWMKGLHSANKTWCCVGDDTDAIDAWEAKDKGYRVKFRGEWYDVPKSALVDGPNLGGDALLWMNKGWSGMSVRCFMPGSLT